MPDVTQAYSIADLRRMAERCIPRPIFDFFDGGAEDEVTLRDNRAAFEREIDVTGRQRHRLRADAGDEEAGQRRYTNLHAFEVFDACDLFLRDEKVIAGAGPAGQVAEIARAMGLVHRVVPGAELGTRVRELAHSLLAKPFRPLAEMKARINAIARTGMPEVNAMTEGFLRRD